MMSINAQAMGFIKSYGRTRERYGAAMLSGALSGSIDFEGKKFDCRGGDTQSGEVDDTAKQVYFYKAHKPVAGTTGGVDQANRFCVAPGKGLTRHSLPTRLRNTCLMSLVRFKPQ